MIAPLLLRVKEVLDQAAQPGGLLHGPSMSPPLTRWAEPARIGTNGYKLPSYPSIEFGTEDGNLTPRGEKEGATLRVTVYDDTESATVIRIASVLPKVLTPENLTDVGKQLTVALSSKTRERILPRNDFAHLAEVVFTILFTNPNS